MTHIVRHLRVIAFFLMFIISISYFLKHTTTLKTNPVHSLGITHSVPAFYVEGEDIVDQRPLQGDKSHSIGNGPFREGKSNAVVEQRPLKGGKSPSEVNANQANALAQTNEDNIIKDKNRLAVNDDKIVSHTEIPQGEIAQVNREDEIEELTEILVDKIGAAYLSGLRPVTKPSCATNVTISNSCDVGKKCLRMGISENPRERITQILSPKELQMTPAQSHILHQMREKVPGSYDVIILTASSSNHFLESQALVKNLHETVFPHLKNFTFIYYDIGLTKEHRDQLSRNCRCKVVDFPFEQLPKYMKSLRCYAWKPLMIKAHIQQGNVVVWMDASVRIGNFGYFNKLINRTKERGFQMAGPSQKSPFRTVRSMYHFFGDEPCAYLNMGQLHATSGFYHRERFTERAILEPWVACALNRTCICPNTVIQDQIRNRKMVRDWEEKGTELTYGLVHRFDQSAISLIIHKLFHKFFPWVVFNKVSYNMSYLRNDIAHYFPPILPPASKIVLNNNGMKP